MKTALVAVLLATGQFVDAVSSAPATAATPQSPAFARTMRVDVRSVGAAAAVLAGFELQSPGAAAAQETRTADGGAPPRARIADLAWIAGTWEGEGISGPAREVYSAPLGGQIAGHFTQTRNGAVTFHEFITIAERDGSIEYRIKHFNSDHTGWEERNQVQRFRLVAVESDAWYFDGLTLRRDGDNGLISAVRVTNPDGTSRELVFRYRRIGAGR